MAKAVNLIFEQFLNRTDSTISINKYIYTSNHLPPPQSEGEDDIFDVGALAKVILGNNENSVAAHSNGSHCCVIRSTNGLFIGDEVAT